MIVRAIDLNNDWTFGAGRNSYRRGKDAVAQAIQTRLQCFLGDCFFDRPAGIDWFTYLGGKNILGLRLAIRGVILNTENVTSVVEVQVILDNTRRITISYTAQTSIVTATDSGIVSTKTAFILTEGGDIITSEDGGAIQAG